MHKHQIAHLDISLTNLLTDYRGRCAFIDYELSRRFKSTDPTHLVYHCRSTELPPESGKNTPIDPYKADVWALAVLLLRSCKVCLSAIFCPDQLLIFWTAHGLLGSPVHAYYRTHA